MNRKRMQRCLAMLLTVCMVMGLFVGTAGAAGTAASGFTAEVTESVSVTGSGNYPVTFTLTNPTKKAYSITLKTTAGHAALTYRGTTENNGTITLSGYTKQEISGYLTFTESTGKSDVKVQVMSGDTVLDTVTIDVVALDACRAAYYDFDEDAEGWSGPMVSHTDRGSIYISINGGTGGADSVATSGDKLALTTGNLYRLSLMLKGVKVFDQEMAARVMVCDYDANGNALSHPYSLNQQCLLDGTEQTFDCYFVANSLKDQNYAYSKLSFRARDDSGSVTMREQLEIDDVLLIDAGAAEAIEVPNGNFETLGADGFAVGKQGFTYWSTNTMASRGTTQAAGPGTSNYYTAFEGAEMMNIMPGTFIKYNSTSFQTEDQILINAWIKYAAWRNMGTPTFTLHVNEKNSSGESLGVKTIATTIFASGEWMNIQGIYTKPSNVQIFNIGVDVNGTEWVGTFVDHMTIHKSAVATGLTIDQVNARIPSFAGELPNSSDVTELAAPVVTELEKPEVPNVTITNTDNTLSLDGIVHINQYAAITGGNFTPEFIEDNGGLLIWKSKPAEVDYATADEVVEGLEYNAQYKDYGQATNGIAAKEFADELYMSVYLEYAEGEYIYGPVKEFSVQQYCEKVIAQNKKPALVDVAVAMLHYGSAAQNYFGYNTDDMANANIAADHPADTWNDALLNELVPYISAPESTGDVNSTGKTLALEGAVLMNYYFQTSADIVSGKLQIWDSARKLTECNVTAEQEMVFSPGYGGEWTATSLDFVAKEYAKTTYARAVLTDSEGKEHTSDIVTFSPEAYAQIVINQNKNAKLVELSKHLVMYGERARLYFGAPEVPEIPDEPVIPEEPVVPLDPTTPVDPKAESEYLVYNNQPRAHIMLAENATDLEVMAAEELQSHVELVTGATLPITGVDPSEGGFTAAADPAVIYAAEDDYYPVQFVLRNPTEKDKTVTLRQKSDTEKEPKLTIRGDNGNDGVVTVKAQSQLVVSGYFAVEDVFAYAPSTVEVEIVEKSTVIETMEVAFAGRGTTVEDGGFETSPINWSNATILKSQGRSGNALRILNGKEGIYGANLKLIPNHMYMLRFYGKSSAASASARASVSDYNASGEILPVPMSMNRSIAVNSSDWTYFEHRFVANTDSNPDYAYSVLSLTAKGTGYILIDDLMLVDCGPVEEEEYRGGDLEEYTTSGVYRFPGTALHHTCYEDVKTPYSGKRAAHMVSGYPEYTHSLGGLRTMKEGMTYSISFWAKTGMAGSIITFHNNTWVNHQDYGHVQKTAFAVTDQWERYEYVWTAPMLPVEGEEYNGTYFNFQYTGEVYLDHIQIHEADTAHDLADEMSGNAQDLGGTMPSTAPAIPAPIGNDLSIFIVTPDSYPELADIFAEDMTWLGETDGFSIRRRGGTIYIFGSEVRGTMNGVYDFLEDNLGVIWFRADDTAYVPMSTVKAPAERREQSPFEIRSWHFGGTGDNGEAMSDADTELMISRNKLNGKQVASQNAERWDYYESIGLELFQNHHNVIELITGSPIYDSSIKEYWNTDADGNYFESGDHAHNINFWSELTFETAYATVEKWLKDDAYKNYIPISLMDNNYMTQLPYSAQPFEYAPGQYVQPGAANYNSTVFFTWLNRIAARVKQTHPDVKIVSQAYWATETPPACELEDNIYIVFASVAEDVRRDLWDTASRGQNTSIWPDLQVWEQKTSNIIMYHYIGGRVPCSRVEVWEGSWLQTHMQYYAESDSYIGMNPEGTVDACNGKNNWAMNQLTLWLYHKLTWDPYIDMDAYIEHFCDTVYGPAADYMKQYYDLLDQAWFKTTFYSCYTDSAEGAFKNQIINSGLTSQIQAALNNAYNAVPSGSVYQERLAYIRDTFNTNVTEFGSGSSGGSGSCITPDTQVTLADGTQVRVDALTGNEELLVWNMETGMLDSAPVMFVDSDPEAEAEVVHLYFSDGTDVKVIYEHGFWDYDLNRYVYLDSNAAEYIGHSFAKQNGNALEQVQLTDVVIETERTTAWSPVTAEHLCYFVNGMLSMPGGAGGLFNIFDVEPETMTYDPEALARDIETYGLFTYEELNAIEPLPEEMFEAAGGAYLKISMGKGNLTMEALQTMIRRYSKFF